LQSKLGGVVIIKVKTIPQSAVLTAPFSQGSLCYNIGNCVREVRNLACFKQAYLPAPKIGGQGVDALKTLFYIIYFLRVFIFTKSYVRVKFLTSAPREK